MTGDVQGVIERDNGWVVVFTMGDGLNAFFVYL